MTKQAVFVFRRKPFLSEENMPTRLRFTELHLRKPQDSCNHVLWTRGQEGDAPPSSSGLITCQAWRLLCFSQSQDPGPHRALMSTVGVHPKLQMDKFTEMIMNLCFVCLGDELLQQMEKRIDAHGLDRGDPMFLKTMEVCDMLLMLQEAVLIIWEDDSASVVN